MAITSILASSVGYAKALKITLLLFFLVEYLVIFLVYLVLHFGCENSTQLSVVWSCRT
jgi:hypothetical protein